MTYEPDDLEYRRTRERWLRDQRRERARLLAWWVILVGGAVAVVVWASSVDAAVRPQEARTAASVRCDVQELGLLWCRLADCESGDGTGTPPYWATWDYRGYFHGGLQFLPSTWTAAIRLVPGWQPRYAYRATDNVQVRVARRWLRATSWHQWPTCARRIGVL